MGYHNTRLPETFSSGSLFGPGFKTEITETDGGSESRLQRYPPAGRRQYNLALGITSLEKLRELQEFYIARQGAENSFRVKDWSDYSTTPSWTTHRDSDASPDGEDVLIGFGDGTTTQFQLRKKYESGPTTVWRTIRKPVAGTLVVTIDGADNVAWTLNDETGVITFTVAPALDAEIRAGYEFDVPCRFSEEADALMQISIEAVEAGSLPAIMVIEDLDPVTISQSRDLGGAYDHGSITNNLTISELNGVVQSVNPTVGSLKMFLPLPQETGGVYFVFKNNNASNTITIRNNGDTATLAVLAVSASAGSLVTVWLGLSGTTKTWYAQ